MVLAAATSSVPAMVVAPVPMVAVRNRKAVLHAKVMHGRGVMPPDVVRVPKPVALNHRVEKVVKAARVRKGHRGVNAAKGNRADRKAAWMNLPPRVVPKATGNRKPSPERASDSRLPIVSHQVARRRIIGVGLLSRFTSSLMSSVDRRSDSTSVCGFPDDTRLESRRINWARMADEVH